MGIITGNNPFDLVLTTKQIEQVQSYAIEIVENLPPKAINELLEGYNHDQEALMNEIFRQVNTVINFNATLESEKLDYLEGLEKSMDATLKKLSYNYFKTTCLPNFNQGWRNMEWGNLVQLFPWSLFLAHRGGGKCFAKGTKVVMFDGSLKNIEDIVIGDELMGRDNTPRKVLSLHKGEDDLYEIEQKMFKNYIVNSKHDMFFKRWKSGKVKNRTQVLYDESLATEIIMEARDLCEKKENYFENIFGVGVNGWELPEANLLIEPYFLGYWIGDGKSRSSSVTTIDKEVIEYVNDYAERLNLICNNWENSIVYHIRTKDWFISRKDKNILLENLKKYNLINNKHIPEEYFLSSRKQRLELLAGLIDSDGHNPKAKKNSYIFTQKNKEFSLQFQRLCWSLGFRCNISEHTHKSSCIKGGIAQITHVHLSGDLSQIPCKIKRKKIERSFSESKSPQRRGIRIKKIGKGEYYGFTCDKDHLFLLEDGTVVKNSYEWCYAFPLWRIYSYDKPIPFQKETVDNKNRKETLIITNESTLGKTHMAKITEEIRDNSILAEKLNPNGKAELGKEHVLTETGSLIKLRSLYSSGIRGNHSGSVVYDDLLDESSLYSKEQRAKAKEIFIGSMTPVVEPGGFFVGSGTPYVNAQGDIYTDLKSDAKHKVWEYPAISPYYIDGVLKYRLLSPDRFTYKELLQIKESIGSSVFSREYMVTPVTDSSSIFPYEYLNKCINGMENVRFAENIESFPYKLQRVIIGVDWAKSGNVSADYTVITVMGIDSNETYYILNIWRKKGSPYNEQINQLAAFDQRFKPNKIVVENNGFQSIMADLAKNRGLRNIEPFTTTGFNKKNSYEGLPSIAAIMERGQLRVPYAEGYTREMVDIWMTEFNSVAYNEDSGKLEGVGSHDDMCMSSFFAIQELRTKTTKFKFTMV